MIGLVVVLSHLGKPGNRIFQEIQRKVTEQNHNVYSQSASLTEI